MRNFASQVTSSVTTINLSILFAALGIALAVATEHLAERPEIPALTHGVTVLLLWITIIYALCVVVVQFIAVLKAPQKATGVLRSTFAGIFMLLVLIVLIEDNSNGFWLLFIGFVVCIAAFIALSNVSETTTISSGSNAQNSLPSYKPFFPDEEEVNSKGANLAAFAHEFEQDQLYMFPQPSRNSSFRFFTVGRGPSPLENDDACYVSEKDGRYALCDGAAGSKYPRSWGTLLSKQWCDKPLVKNDANTVENWLKGPRKDWLKWVNEKLKYRLDMHAQDRRNAFDDIDSILRLGAATTFLGLSINKGKKEWQATALGNTCLFIFSNNQYQYRDYFSSPKAIYANGKPVLLNSVDSKIDQLASNFQMKQGQLFNGDIFILATQPVAQWIFPPANGKRNSVDQQRDWERRISELLSLETQTDFKNFIMRYQPAQKHGAPAEDYSMLKIINS